MSQTTPDFFHVPSCISEFLCTLTRFRLQAIAWAILFQALVFSLGSAPVHWIFINFNFLSDRSLWVKMLVVDHTLGQQPPPERIRVSPRTEFFNFTAMMLNCLHGMEQNWYSHTMYRPHLPFFPKLHLTKIWELLGAVEHLHQERLKASWPCCGPVDQVAFWRGRQTAEKRKTSVEMAVFSKTPGRSIQT